MRIERVPLSALPTHFGPLAAAFASGDPRLDSRFASPWKDVSTLAAHAKRAGERGVDPDLRLEGPAFERLKRGAPAVVTGQQPSVGLGPLYNVYKAITAVRWARRLDAVPVFWNHSDDDNLLGLNRLSMPDKGGAMQSMEVPWAGEGALAYQKALPDFDRLAAMLPDGRHAGDAMAILRGAVRGDVAGDFSRLLGALFGPELLVIEPRQLDVARSREILSRALAEPGLVQAAVDRGGERMKELGFDRALGHGLGTNVYAFDGPRRVRVDGAPPPGARLSAGVALRLIVQDAVLPTALVVAGPHEAAYLAQLRELYEAFGRTGPVVAPRITATLVDPRTARIADALGLSGAKLFEGEHAIQRAGLRSDVLEEVDAITEDVNRRLGALESGPAGPIQDATRKTRERLRTIFTAYRERVLASAEQADGVGADRARKLASMVTPDGNLQERVLPVWFFVALCGPGLIRTLIDELDPFSGDHQLARL